MTKLSQPAPTILYGQVEERGDVNDTDGVWQGRGAAVEDRGALPRGTREDHGVGDRNEAFQAPVHLSDVIAGASHR